MSNTRDLSLFGYRELAEAGAMLSAYKGDDDLTKHLWDGVAVEFNPNSGNVFMVDDHFNVAMMADGKLCDFFTSPYEGLEGFYEDLKDQYKNMHDEDKMKELRKKYLKESTGAV